MQCGGRYYRYSIARSYGRRQCDLGSSYGACTEIGDNNFVSSNVCLEHGNHMGSHCAFGPGVATSGNVCIGDGVRFGTGIFIEPDVNIGDNVVVASGSVLRNNVPNDSIVRMSWERP